jgi:hypothetical protein
MNSSPVTDDNYDRRDSEIAWQLHTAANMLGSDYKIHQRTVTTRTTIHEEIVIEYNHRNKSDDSTDQT